MLIQMVTVVLEDVFYFTSRKNSCLFSNSPGFSRERDIMHRYLLHTFPLMRRRKKSGDSESGHEFMAATE